MTRPENPQWEFIRDLQSLQEEIDLMPSYDLRRQRMTHVLGYRSLIPNIDKKEIFTTSRLYARKPHILGSSGLPRDGLIEFNRGFIFAGRFSGLSCLEIGDSWHSTISLNFSTPDVLDVDPEDAPWFRQLELLVPVRDLEPLAS